jgi:hypothetical protein
MALSTVPCTKPLKYLPVKNIQKSDKLSRAHTQFENSYCHVILLHGRLIYQTADCTTTVCAVVMMVIVFSVAVMLRHKGSTDDLQFVFFSVVVVVVFWEETTIDDEVSGDIRHPDLVGATAIVLTPPTQVLFLLRLLPLPMEAVVLLNVTTMIDDNVHPDLGKAMVGEAMVVVVSSSILSVRKLCESQDFQSLEVFHNDLNHCSLEH